MSDDVNVTRSADAKPSSRRPARLMGLPLSRSLLALLGAIVVFVVSSSIILAVILRAHNDLVTSGKGDAAWAASQFQAEYWRLHDALHEVELKPDDAALIDQAKLRFDIFYGRVAVINDVGRREGYEASDYFAEHADTFQEVVNAIDLLVPTLAANPGIVAQRMVAILAAIEQEVGHFSSTVSQVVELDEAVVRSDLIRLYRIFAALIVGLVLSGAALIVLLVAQHKATQAEVVVRQRAEEALRASEQRFRDFAESASDWFWETDGEGRFIAFSDRYKAVTGMEPDAWLGKREEDLRLDDPADDDWSIHLADLAARRPFHDFTHAYVDGAGRRRIVQGSGRPFFDQHGSFCGYRGTARDITVLKEAEERAHHLAHHDVLTGLPNRALFADRLDVALATAHRQGRTIALHSLDLNDFKGINDSLGHLAGDELLRQVGRRLSETVRGSDTVARLGGDEFAIVQTDLRDFGDSATLARRVLASLGQPCEIEGRTLRCTASIGVAHYPEDGSDAQTLLRNADVALYQTKSGQPDGGFTFFLPRMNQALSRRQNLERDLSMALERNQFVLHYQPQIRLSDGAIIGFEGLLRWNHPERGLLPPNSFLGVAEAIGLIGPIGRWTLMEAGRALKAWHERGWSQLVAINLSASQIRHGNIASSVAEAIAASDVDPARLELEIGEGQFADASSDDFGALLRRLSAIGVRVAVDNFGSGHLSLSLLKRLPADRIKIDRSFVDDISGGVEDASLVTAIVALGHHLGTEVIAEGVETRDQLDFLRQHGCDQAQGFLLSRPLGADRIAAFLQGWPAIWQERLVQPATIDVARDQAV